ncbi:pentapeptide repeat-containing protein, partial [Enterobacter cloacae]|uniref:pentapeptide repeat-containing protein n=1 Tax=Enterobacter cloacae TaxID=550 RepID=UPI001953CA60
LGGADLTGVTVIGTDFDGADLASAKLGATIGLDQAKNFDKAKNRDRLMRK